MAHLNVLSIVEKYGYTEFNDVFDSSSITEEAARYI